MNCPVCNKEIKETDLFCKTCGTAFSAKHLAFSTVKENPITKPLSFWKFFWLIFVGLIPVLNIITYLILAFKPMSNLNIKAYSRAGLVYSVIYTVLCACGLWLMLY